MSRPHTLTLFPYTTLFRSEGFAHEGFDVVELPVVDGKAGVYEQRDRRGAERAAGHLRSTGPPQRNGFRLLEHRAGQHGCAHRDRKSTRLNSSHLGISYAVF